MTGTDAYLWYNVGDWGRFGLAIPNFSNDTRSQNDTIRYLNDVMGRNLQAILWHPDARLRTPPSINTLTRIHKLCTRARSILASYNPSARFTSTEMLDTVPNLEDWPTEDDLQILTDGIPISQLPMLGRWPNGPMTGSTSATGSPAARESFAAAPGV